MPDTDNGRITLAILSEQNATMQRTLESIRRIVEGDHDCLTKMTTHQSDTDKRLGEHEEDIEHLKTTSNTWNGINTALALVGAAFASWLGLRN